MDRVEYLEMCRQVAKLPEGIKGIKLNVPEELQVNHAGINFFPVGIEISFKATGETRNTAKMHDLKSNSVTYAPLEKVIKTTDYVEPKPQNDDSPK